MPVVTKVLEKASNNKEEPFWIDDVFVTGMLRPKEVPVYSWSANNLRTHAQNTEPVLRGTLFSPELMLAADLTPEEMRVLHTKFVESKRKGWQDIGIYGHPENVETLRPPKIAMDRDEL